MPQQEYDFRGVQIWSQWTTASTGTVTVLPMPVPTATSATTANWTQATTWQSWIVHDWPAQNPDRAGPTFARAERAAAKERSEELWLSMLDETQRRQDADHGYIEGVTNLGHPYRIHTRRGISGNVELLDDGHWLTLCAHPPANLPQADLLLGQKLALDTNEEYFMSRANVHRVRAA